MTQEERDSILNFIGSVDDFFNHIADLWEGEQPIYSFKWGNIFPVPFHVYWVFDEQDADRNTQIMEVVQQTSPWERHHESSDDGVHIFDYVSEKGFHTV